MRLARQYGLTSEEVILGPSPYQSVLKSLDVEAPKNSAKLAAAMKSDLEKTRKRKEAKEMLRLRQNLPLMAETTQRTLLRLIDECDVVIVVAKTGSGKTTQVPQIILDDKILSGQGPSTNVLCTQPRRIAATSVARRVADERLDLIRKTVGYHIRNENWSPNLHGSITYCTTGILMNRLISDPDETLQSHSHIIIDEVHERDVQIDLVVSILRKVIRVRKAAGLASPKVILMSATIDPTTFLNYFRQPAKGGNTLRAESFDVNGSPAQVDHHFLQDILDEISPGSELHPVIRDLLHGRHQTHSSKLYIQHEMGFAADHQKMRALSSKTDGSPSPLYMPSTADEIESQNITCLYVGLATAVIAHIAKNKPNGDILVFLPGLADIEHVAELLTNGRFKSMDLDFEDIDKFRIFKLHSQRRETNDDVFKPVPVGCRRIILSTNIAETSITLPEVVYVVDSGKVRSCLFDPSTLARRLPYAWVSRTSALQRGGRAGRVRNGHYYALFSKERYESLAPMNRPKITISDLVDVALQLKASPQNIDIEEYLLETMDPPSPEAVEAAIKSLQRLHALTEDREITSLGRLLARFGLHPAFGKGILLGAMFHCLEPMLIVACDALQAPLIQNLSLPVDKIRDVKRQYLPQHESDFVPLIQAFKEYHAAYQSGDTELVNELRETKYISHRAYLDMMVTSTQIHELLTEIGYVPPPKPGQSLFECLPEALNTNGNNMVLVKALLMKTISAELAAWRGRLGRASYWSTDNRVYKGMISRLSINDGGKRAVQRLRRQYRSDGRLIAYSWKQEVTDGSFENVWLEQTSMVTPLMAILFSQNVTLQKGQILKLNDWLRLNLSPAEEVPSAIGENIAEIMMELRKTIDRFLGLAWAELEKFNCSEGSISLVQADVTTTPLNDQLRQVMVDAVVNMLDADEIYWRKFAETRRTAVALIIEQQERNKELQALKSVDDDDDDLGQDLESSEESVDSEHSEDHDSEYETDEGQN